MIGRTISQYRILERVGKGAMGVVYKARDLNLDRVVALKFLPPHLVACDDAIGRFLREARAISTLNHPNIATIHDLCRRQGEIFLVLEYLPGGTLRSLVRDISSSGGKLAPKQLLEFALGIAEGLSHAHRQGIIHRDVKTDNVMLTAEGTVKITDFGLAKLRGSTHLTQAGGIVGTVSYMSPEQARGDPVDHRSDIFSFGVVLYEMATGRLPFRGPNESALLSEILHASPPAVSEARTDLPPAFDEIVSKAQQGAGEGSRATLPACG
jgi:serine/threonine protein kinase